MNTPNNLTKAIHNVLNDVVEQCFRQLMSNPEQRPYIETLINLASRDIVSLEKQLSTPLTQSVFSSEEERQKKVTILLYEKSLMYLGKLQILKNSREVAA